MKSHLSRQLLSLTIVVGSVALSLASCRSGEKAGASVDGQVFGTVSRGGKDPHTFYVNNNTEPEYLDPGMVSDSASGVLVQDLFEGLVSRHPEDARPVPAGAVRYRKSSDNRHYHFDLRPEAKWSDGKPVTAHDYAYSWARVLNAKLGARAATLLYSLKNGMLYHQGKLKVASRDLTIGADPTAPSMLRAGTPLRIWMSSDATSLIVPVPQLADVYVKGGLSYRPPEGNRVATLDSVPAVGEKPVGLARAQKEVVRLKVLGAVAKSRCNGSPDFIYEVVDGDTVGRLPGCALKRDPKSPHVFATKFDDLPTFAATHVKESEASLPSKLPDLAAMLRVEADALKLEPKLLGVRANGDHELQVELARPIPYFLDLCGYTALMPVRRDVVEKFERAGTPELWYRPENIVTNGPYVLEQWRFRYDITFRRNPHYHRHDQLKIHRVVFLAVQEYQSALNLYQTGEIDYIGANGALPAVAMDVMHKYRDFSRSQYLATYWYEFNVKKPPVDDVRVRRALNLAVDKQQIIDVIVRGEQQPATHFVPDYTGGGYDKAQTADPKRFAGKGFEFDPEAARQLLVDAGYTPTKKGNIYVTPDFPDLEILYNTADAHRKIAVAIQDMWRRHLGITVQLRNEEWRVMLKNIRDGRFQITRFGWIADYNHPHTFMDVFLSYSENNRTGWSEPRFDHLVKSAARTADPAKGIALYRQAESLAVKEMPRMPLYFYTKSTLVKPYVRGFYPNARNEHWIRDLWFDFSGKAPNRPAFPLPDFAPPQLLDPPAPLPEPSASASAAPSVSAAPGVRLPKLEPAPEPAP